MLRSLRQWNVTVSNASFSSPKYRNSVESQLVYKACCDYFQTKTELCWGKYSLYT